MADGFYDIVDDEYRDYEVAPSQNWKGEPV